MLTCILCPNTKKLMNKITHQIKGLSLKTESDGKENKKKKRQQKRVIAEEVMEKSEHEEEEEWVAEPEPGVFITLLALANGSNHLKKIRFREDIYDVMGAQRWWSENNQKIIELYSIHHEHQPVTQSQSEDEYPMASVEAKKSNEKSSATCSNSGSAHDNHKEGNHAVDGEGANEKEIFDEDNATVSVVEDKPGVFVTIRFLPDGSKEILQVELSREIFGEVKARVWWEENKARLYRQYT